METPNRFRFRAWDGKQIVIDLADLFVRRDDGMPMEDIFAISFDIQSRPGWVLMQSTGLTDKNGVEIYEGDILEIADTERVVVEWSDSSARLCADIKYAERGWDETICDHIGSVEIIGTIYENPELLSIT